MNQSSQTHQSFMRSLDYHASFKSLKFKYLLKHAQECFIRYKTRAQAERFISEYARLQDSALNGLETNHRCEFIGEVIFKTTVV